MASPTAEDLQKSLDEFSTKAKDQIAEVGKKAQEAYDELRNHVDGQNSLSSKGLAESIATQKKLQDSLDGYETKQTELHKQLEDMHKAVSRIAAGGSAANDKTYVRTKSNIISLEDYHKAAHKVRGGADTESYLTLNKSDDEIAYEKGFFENLANEASKGDLQKLQRSLIEAKSLIVSDLTSAGFYVPPVVQGRIIDKEFETSPMLQEAEVTSLASGNTLEHIVDREQFTFQLLDEITTPTDSDANLLQLLKIEAFESITRVPVSRRALQDAGIDMSAYVAAKAGDRMGRGFNNLYVNGTGGNQPEGILNTPIATTDDETRAFGTLQNFVTGGATGFVAASTDNIIDMVFSIKSRYEANAKFFSNKFTMGEIRKLKDGQGNYIWQPDFTKLASSTLVGYPIVRFEDMPSLAAGTRSLLFGDMRQAYHVINRLGIMSVVDDLSDDRFVIYKFFQRSGGRPTDSEAMRVMVTST